MKKGKYKIYAFLPQVPVTQIVEAESYEEAWKMAERSKPTAWEIGTLPVVDNIVVQEIERPTKLEIV